MRNLLFLLVLANVMYFLWERFVAEPDQTGIAVVQESDLGPPLTLAEAIAPAADTGDEEPAPDDGTATPEEVDPTADILAEDDDGEEEEDPATRRPELLASAGRSCVTVGPFRETREAEGALADFEQQGMRGVVRKAQGEVFVGHWVQIRDIPDRATANRMLTTLKSGGLGEAYIVQTEDEGIKISLGLFGDLSGAERTELQAKSMDLPADISPRMRQAEVAWVDIGLPPGKGAGSMIERYGEDKVLLRDAATCPSAG